MQIKWIGASKSNFSKVMCFGIWNKASSFLVSLWSMCAKKVVYCQMFPLRDYFKILYSVVMNHTILMMNYFLWFEFSTKMLFDNISMFKYVTIFSRRLVIGFLKIDITSTMFTFATFPVRVVFSSLFSVTKNSPITGNTLFGFSADIYATMYTLIVYHTPNCIGVEQNSKGAHL